MSALPLSHPVETVPAASRARAREDAWAPRVLAFTLLLLLLYAAFDHGAAARSASARIEVAIAAIAAVAGAAWLWIGSLRLAAPRTAVAGVALLTGFAVWSGLTLSWSVAPDATWSELNRAIGYVIVLCLALAIGASDERATRLVARGFALLAFVVSAYALGQKLLPGLHVPGVFNLDQTGPVPRLQEPLGYWNALALFVAMGVPAALASAVDREGARRERLASLIGIQWMVLAIGFTFSRGGVVSLAVALLIAIAAGRMRLRSVMWLGTSLAAAIPPLVVGLTSGSLTHANVGLGSREDAGIILLAVLLASSLLLVLGALKLYSLEVRVQIGPERTRVVARLLAAFVGVVVVIAILAVTLSSRGLDGSVSHAWNTFTATRATSNYSPDRLLSADSENRWVWWKEAAGAFSDRPVAGWGAGSFGVVHLLYRRDTLSVNEPHSVPLQFLAETGLVGAALALVGLGLLFAAGAQVVRREAFGSRRIEAAALLGGVAAYAVHALYDWDWDIPGVTLPALVLLGVLVGSGRARRRSDITASAWGARGTRLLMLGTLTLGLCFVAASAALPSIAATEATQSLVTAGGLTAASVQKAQAMAGLASGLDPLSDGGLRVQATIASRQGRPDKARSFLLQAVRRDPSDGGAWAQLVFLELSQGNGEAASTAAERVVALDPHRKGAAGFASAISQQQTLDATPPRRSPTAGASG